MRMIKYFLFSIYLVLYLSSCEKTKPSGYIGESITLTAKNPDNIKSLKYKWSISEKPENSKIKLDSVMISEDESSLSFVPDFVGHYSLRVSLSWYGEVISIQSFPLEIAENVINEVKLNKTEPSTLSPPSSRWKEDDKSWLEESIKKPITNKTIEPASSFFIPPKDSSFYTIQVAAKKDEESADKYMKEMHRNGFDAYIQRYYKKKSNELWYRIRVGAFNSKDSAIVVAGEIQKTMQLQPWIDYVRKTKE